MTPEEKNNMEHLIDSKIKDSVVFLGEHLAQSLQGVVKVTVNGKIDRLSEKLGNYIKEDMEWKDRAEPLVKAYESNSFFWNSVIKKCKGIGTVGGAITLVGGVMWGAFKLAVFLATK